MLQLDKIGGIMKKSLYCLVLISLVFNIRSTDFDKKESKELEEAIAAAKKIIDSEEFQDLSSGDKANLKNYFILEKQSYELLIAHEEEAARIRGYDAVEFRKRLENENAFNIMDRLNDLVNNKRDLFQQKFYDAIIALLTPEKPYIT